MGWIERELVPRAREGCDVTLPWEHNKTNDDGDGKENGEKINSGYYMVVRRCEISLQHEKRNLVSVRRPYVLSGAGSNYQSVPQPELDI